MKQKKVVVIDDDRYVLSMCEQMLSSEGYDVFPFSCPKKAVDFITDDIDLVITDFEMPFMDGSEVVEESSKEYSGKYILISGVLGNVKDTSKFAFLLQKPFSLSTFISACKICCKE